MTINLDDTSPEDDLALATLNDLKAAIRRTGHLEATAIIRLKLRQIQLYPLYIALRASLFEKGLIKDDPDNELNDLGISEGSPHAH